MKKAIQILIGFIHSNTNQCQFDFMWRSGKKSENKNPHNPFPRKAKSQFV
jgi:hypothetical protein